MKALVHALLRDRQLARANIWTLQHIFVLANFAAEALQVPHITHPVFSKERITTADLKEVVEASQRIAAYVLASANESSSWHTNVVNALSGATASNGLGSIGQLTSSLFKQSLKGDSFRETSVLYKVLQHILPNADTTAADKWIDLARQIEPQGPASSFY